MQTESRLTLTVGTTVFLSFDTFMYIYAPETGTFVRSNIGKFTSFLAYTNE